MLKEMTIFKKILLNGLTILVRPVDTIPKVSMQLWYHVGSKDELSGQKGLAHLIEHMIFKGTDQLSESDINVITHKLSGYCNAFTSYDATGYVFDFPSQNWKTGLLIYADCMRNAKFDEQMLNSELKAVIQELKMYKDDYVSTLIQKMMGTMIHDHPYHYPIIGFKQDLWNLNRDALVNFYKTYYVPSNALLVVVGDVDPEDVFAEAEKTLGSITVDSTLQKQKFYHGKDLASTSTTLYRDVQQPIVLLSYILPGIERNSDNQYVYDCLSWILGAGKGSRLTRLLVDELQLVTSVETFSYTLEDLSPFFIYFQPKNIEDIENIIQIIQKEILKLSTEVIANDELERAIKKMRMSFLSLLESNKDQASLLADMYLLAHDENYIQTYLNFPIDTLSDRLQALVKKYCIPAVMHKGMVLPLSTCDNDYWHEVQELSDKEDSYILDGRVRITEVESARYADTVIVHDAQNFLFKHAHKSVLSNGIRILSYSNKTLPKIDIVIGLNASDYYDPVDNPGLYEFLCEMITEGTQNYPGTLIAQEFEHYGMSFSISPGYITLSCLSDDLEKGLSLLQELLQKATFNEDAIEKIRHKMLAARKDYEDDSKQISNQLMREAVYKDHPYAKNLLGTVDSIMNIQRSDLVEYYAKFINAHNAVVSIVGDFSSYDISAILEKYLGDWKSVFVKDITFPELTKNNTNIVNYYINRDQINLGFVGLSVDRLDPDYDALLLFDQIFGGGVNNSMSSRLFELREQTGLFYTIKGSLIAQADKEPGMVFIKTIVSLDRLEEAKRMIINTIDTVIDTLTDEDLIAAKQAVINAQVDNFSSFKRTAMTFLFLNKYNLSDEYFDNRLHVINNITLDEVKKAASKVLNSKHMVTVQVGRVNEDTEAIIIDNE